MRKIMTMIAFASAFVFMQACGPKSGKNETTASSVDSVAFQKKIDSTKAADEKASKEKAKEERKRLAAEKKAKDTYEVSGTTVYNRADVKPSFKGGQSAMNKYFKDNLKYPSNSPDPSWQGTVYVDFVVGADGKVQYAEITDDTPEDTDQVFKEEALRVVMAMPSWVPGAQHGKPVPVSFNLPIVFDGGI